MLVMRTPDDIPELGEGPELATIEQRLRACLIDAILSGGVVIATFAFSAWCSNGELWFNESGGLFGFIPTLVVLLLGWSILVIDKVGTTGQTIGKSKVGIKVIPVEPIIDGEEIPLGFGRAFAREIVGKNILGPLTLGIGLLAPLFDERRQGLQDAVAETIVVKSDEYEEWIHWMQHGTRLLEREQKRQKERLQLELRRIEDDQRMFAIRAREQKRIMDDHRAHREGGNRLRREWGLRETDDEKRERLQAEVHADLELRREREQKRIEDEENQRAYYKRELERIIQDDRTGRERIKTLRWKLGLINTDDEEMERLQEEERAERELRKSLERAMELNETNNSGN